MRIADPTRALLPLVVLLTLIVIRHAAAQMTPQVSGLTPAAISRGQTADVMVNGSALAGVDAVDVANPRGVSIELVPPAQPANDGELKLKITAAPDAVPGEREFRLISPTGVSPPLKISVEQYPSIPEAEPNNSLEQAQAVEGPAVLVGKIEGAGDADIYKITATKGQTLILNVFASRIRSNLDPNLILYDTAGKEVASNNDTHGPDSFLAYDIPVDGVYTIELRDLQYRGGGDYFYRIEAGAIPYLTALEPMAGQRGKVVDVQLHGYNLAGADQRKADLTFAQPGRVPFRAHTPEGLYSNELPFEITELPPIIEVEPNDEAPQATAVTMPADVTGIIAKSGDVDFFRISIPSQAALSVEVIARRLGSPLDALLTLHNADGAPLERNDDSAGADARLAPTLEPGDYLFSMRDLAFSGGLDFAYRLSIRPGVSSGTSGPMEDFAVRFLPDAAQINRGSHAKFWFDVSRINGYKGEITVTLENLPAGVSGGPVTLGEGASGVMTLSAAPDAALGSFPIRMRATGTVNGQLVTRIAQPLFNGNPAEQAYLTVLEPAPFTVSPVATLPPEQLIAYAGEIAALAGKLASEGDQLAARQAEWEQKVAAAPAWTTLQPVQLTSRENGTFTAQPDGSVLATSAPPPADVYNLTFTSDLQGIVAIRLEALSDPSLPNQGPGRAPNGNFVLHELKITAAATSDPSQAQPVALQNARASFSQGSFDVAGAADNNGATGWAISPETGKNQTAVFFTPSPIGFEGGTTYTVTMEQNFGGQHVLGKFRLSVTTDPAAADAPPLPDAIRAIVLTPPDQRTPEQTTQLAEFYRSIDPGLAADRTRLEVLRNVIAPYAEIARLEPALSQQTPELDAAQGQWEQQILSGGGWTTLDFTDLKSENGTALSKEPDGSIFAAGPTPPQESYTLTATTPLKSITALRVEVLTDPRLPANGPGRNADGNFLLTDVKATLAPAASPGEAAPLEFASAKATFEQADGQAAMLIDDNPSSGWGIAPQVGRPHAATLYLKSPAGGDGGNVISLTLSQKGPPNLTLGRFRVLATSNPTPDAIPALPPDVLAILNTPAGNRNDPQKARLADYYRWIAPALQPARQRIAELRSMVTPFPVVTARGQSASIPVAISRNNFPGDVTVTLEGFQSGREGNGPDNIAKSLKAAPLILNGGATLGVLSFQVEGAAEQGTKLAVLRAEAMVDGQPTVQYSPAFPITVQ